MFRHAKLVEASQEEMLKTVLDREAATVARYDARLAAQDELLKEMAEALRACRFTFIRLGYTEKSIAVEGIDATLAKYDAMKEGRG
jgi:hypothetical protein